MRTLLPFAARAGPHNPRFCPQPHRVDDPPALWQGVAAALADFELPRGRDALLSLLRSAPLAAAAIVFLTALVLQLVRERSDASEIELVLLRTPPELELPAEPEILPEPEPVPVPVAEKPPSPPPEKILRSSQPDPYT